MESITPGSEFVDRTSDRWSITGFAPRRAFESTRLNAALEAGRLVLYQ